MLDFGFSNQPETVLIIILEGDFVKKKLENISSPYSRVLIFHLNLEEFDPVMECISMNSQGLRHFRPVSFVFSGGLFKINLFKLPEGGLEVDFLVHHVFDDIFQLVMNGLFARFFFHFPLPPS